MEVGPCLQSNDPHHLIHQTGDIEAWSHPWHYWLWNTQHHRRASWGTALAYILIFFFRVIMKSFLTNFSSGEATLCQLVLHPNSKRKLLSARPPKGSLLRVKKILKARHYIEYRTYKPPSRKLLALPFCGAPASSAHWSPDAFWSCPGVLCSPLLPYQCSCWAIQDVPSDRDFRRPLDPMLSHCVHNLAAGRFKKSYLRVKGG